MISFRNFITESTYKAQSCESEILHHLTPHKFDKFRPMSHFGTAKAARAVMKNKVDDEIVGKNDPINAMTVRIKLGNVRSIPDDNLGHDPRDVNDLLYSHNHISKKQYETNKKKGNRLTNNDLAKCLRSNNIQTLKYKNQYEDPGSTSYIITDPNQVRKLRTSYNAKINLDRYESFVKE
jgi:hypothetical protein